MADELTSLVVAVDSTSAKTAVSDLDSLASAGDRADRAVKKLEADFSSATFSNTRMMRVNQSLAQFRQGMQQAGASATKASADISKATFTPAQMYAANQSLRQYRENMQAAAAAAAKASADISSVTFNPRQMYAVNRSLNEYKRHLAETAAASNAMVRTNGVVAASHHQVSKAAAGYTKSQKELAFASRNLPAQFTDIAVSLQAGQNPMTVLLQQGGQLKDMFGGIGPAARAMGGYIAGLVTPLNLAAAAAAALVVAWTQGESEASEFNKSIELTGNFASTTSDRLTDMARGMAEFGTTQRAASRALAEVASTGRFTEQQIGMIGQAALDMERATGQAVSETVDQFEKLGESPVEAALKLNKTYHFLTSSVYEQIKALEEQGNTLGAAQVAMEAYADAVESRTADVEENLGTLQRAWRGVVGAAKAAWDAMLDIGRAETGREKFNALQEELAELQNPSNAASYAHLQGADRQRRIDAIREEMRELSNARIEEQKRLNREQQTRMAEEASMDLDREAARFATNAEKRNRERIAIQRKSDEAYRNAMAVGNRELAERIREDEEAILAGIDKKYADKPKRSSADREAERALKAQEREYSSLNERIAEHSAILAAASEQEENLSTVQKFAAKTLSDMENGYSLLSEAQQNDIRQKLELLLATDELNREQEKRNKLLEINAEINARIAMDEARRASEQSREIRGMGHGRETNELMASMDDIRDNAMQDRLHLAEEYGKQNRLNSREYLDQLQRINEAEQRQLQNEISHMERRREAAADWRVGARSAIEDIGTEMGDVAGRTRDGFLTAFSSMEQAIDRFAQTGKFKIRDFAKVVLAELLKIELRILLSKALTAMFGGFTGGGGGGMGGGGFSGGYTGDYSGIGSGYTGGGLPGYAMGGAFAGGRQLAAYALGGPLGGVRTSPALFAMANGGAGLMAEHKPEAIMPLERGPNGKLGVSNFGGGGGTQINVSTNVNIANDGSASSRTSSDMDEGRRLGNILDKRIREVLAEERRQGGSLWAMQNGR